MKGYIKKLTLSEFHTELARMKSPVYLIETPEFIYFSDKKPDVTIPTGCGRVFSQEKELRWIENACYLFYESDSDDNDSWDLSFGISVNIAPELNPEKRVRTIKCIRYSRNGIEKYLRFTEVVS